METLIAALVFIGVSILLLSIGIILKKDGKFPDTEISNNKAMLKKGIKCAKHDEIKMWRKKGVDASCESEVCGPGGCDGCAFSSIK
jgi:hypothetical protein